MDPVKIQALEQALGYAFKSHALLKVALTHRSHSSDHYERLEFLGDSVLNCAVSILLYKTQPNEDEGKLSRVRSHLVRQDCLAAVGRRLNLDQMLYLGAGELKGGSRVRDSIVADAFEALIGAILLDAGFDRAQACVFHLLEPVLTESPADSLGKDAKTRLQELLQAKRMKLPIYTVLVEGGSVSSPEFTVECAIESPLMSQTGTGPSRRVAEQQAAQALLQEIEEKGLQHG